MNHMLHIAAVTQIRLDTEGRAHYRRKRAEGKDPPGGHAPGLDPTEWTPRELRHSFVSVLSDAGVPLEQISQLVGHSGTTVTELVYRHQLRPVVQTGPTVMDQLFDQRDERA